MKLKSLMAAALLVVSSGMAWASAGPLTPRVVGWEQFFTLDWEGALRNDRPIVQGHIRNDWGVPARQIRLLVDTLDSGGHVVAQKLEWFPGMLQPGTQAYFQVPVTERAPSYRVSVYAFEWVQAGGGDNR